MKSNVCAFTSLCQEDEVWVTQYLQEADRLGMDLAIHFDRCKDELIELVRSFPKVVTITRQDDLGIEFDETHKQKIFDSACHLKRYDWLMAWDVDETYEREAVGKIDQLTRECIGWDCVDVQWVNLWGSKKFIRTDGVFSSGHRVKFYNLTQSRRWRFAHKITNGAKLLNGKGEPRRGSTVKFPLVAIHWGMMTRDLRRFHKERWDRIYSTALKGDENPYGFWKWAIETEAEAVVVRHDLF